MTSVTGFEHVTPVRIKDTSATERSGFRKCRRSWFLQTVHRLDRQEGNVNFFLGRIYHSALEAYYGGIKSGVIISACEMLALDAYQAAYDEQIAVIKDQLGSFFSFGESTFKDAGELGLDMLQNYLERERDEPLLDEVIAVEFRVRVAIVNASGRRVGWLSVQADVVGMKGGQLAVVDHKTASSYMPSAHLDLDDQLTAEVYSWWKHSDECPEIAIYNVSLKKSPHPPKLLKNGKLSVAKNQNTSPALYRQAIVDNGLNIADYVEYLAILDEKDDPLFRRETTFRTPGQMANFEANLFEEFRDMKAVALHPERAYPNPTSMNCGGCPVRVICTTMMDNGDVPAIINAEFTISEPRR